MKKGSELDCKGDAELTRQEQLTTYFVVGTGGFFCRSKSVYEVKRSGTKEQGVYLHDVLMVTLISKHGLELSWVQKPNRTMICITMYVAYVNKSFGVNSLMDESQWIEFESVLVNVQCNMETYGMDSFSAAALVRLNRLSIAFYLAVRSCFFWAVPPVPCRPFCCQVVMDTAHSMSPERLPAPFTLYLSVFWDHCFLLTRKFFSPPDRARADFLLVTKVRTLSITLVARIISV